VSITAITQDGSDHWDVENFSDLLAEPPWLGDCRDDAMLLKAGVYHCRAILLATNNETVNIETAIAARPLQQLGQAMSHPATDDGRWVR